ncbi:hypothetical protein [Roseomonas sp. HF4]|uniref:hypothetical protein n=1 Tax=Roseomonas sp. HF4 TaxID=2562313 RepID=UPI0010C05B69|nr:hypothetical protein [Roseomonas sp. HF4]
MINALAMPTETPQQVALRERAIADARTAALTAARSRPVSEDIATRVDRLLGLPAVDPTLGLPR